MESLVCTASLQLRNISKLRLVESKAQVGDYPVLSQSLEVPFQLCKTPQTSCI